MGKVLGICVSEKRGTQKKEVNEAVLKENWGIEGDAHAGDWHRQVSLLSFEKIEAFRERGADVDFGAFGENLIVEGYDLRRLPVGTRFRIGEAVLELTQIGKECHSHCEIYKKMGDCIMPREGVFTEVVKGGRIRKGDAVEMEAPSPDRPYTAAVITLSDKGVRAVKEPADPSGGPAADGCDLHHRRHRILRTGSDAGSHDPGLRPDGKRHRGRHPSLFYDDHAPGHVQPGGLRDPGKDPDHQPAGKPKGSGGSAGVSSAAAGSRAGYPAGNRRRMRKINVNKM